MLIEKEVVCEAVMSAKKSHRSTIYLDKLLK